MVAISALFFVCSLSVAHGNTPSSSHSRRRTQDFNWDVIATGTDAPTADLWAQTATASNDVWGKTSRKSSIRSPPRLRNVAKKTNFWGVFERNASPAFTKPTVPDLWNAGGSAYLSAVQFKDCAKAIDDAGEWTELDTIITKASDGIIRIPNAAPAQLLTEAQITTLFNAVPMAFAIAMSNQCRKAEQGGSVADLLQSLHKMAGTINGQRMRGSSSGDVWGTGGSSVEDPWGGLFGSTDGSPQSDPIDENPEHEETYEQWVRSGAPELEQLQDHLSGATNSKALTKSSEVGGTGLFEDIGSGISQFGSDAWETAQDGAKWVKKSYGQLRKAVKNVAKKVIAAIKKYVPIIINAIGKHFQNIGKVVVSVAKGIGEGVTKVAHAIGDAIEFLASCFDLPDLFSCKPGLYGEAGAKIECAIENCEITGTYSPTFSGRRLAAGTGGDMTFTGSLDIIPSDVVIAVDLAGPELIVTIPGLTIDVSLKAEYHGSLEQYQSLPDGDKSSFSKEVSLFNKEKVIKKGVAMAGVVPIVYQVYVRVELDMSASVEAAMETSLEISLPNVELVESMDFGFKSENGKMVPVFGDVTSIPSKLKKTLADKMKNAIKTNGGATLTAALAVGIKLTLILGVRANGVPIEIPIPLWLQAEVSAAGTVQGDLASGVLFSTSGQVKVEVTSSLTAADIGARIPGRDETIGVLCDAIAELAPACIRDIIAEFCIIPLEKAIPDFDAIEFELTKIPKLDFGVLASFTKKFGSAEGGTVPGQSAQCTIQLKKRRSSSSCQSGKSYWCQGDNMFVARGCRGDFVCNGGSKQVRCQSRNYKQAICSCAPLPKAILPCTLRTGQLRPSGGGGGGGGGAGVYYPYRPAQNPTKPDCGESICWGSFPGYEMPTYAYWKVGGGFTAGGPGVTYTLEDAKAKCSAKSECSGVQCDGNQFHQADSANDEAKPAVPLYGENTLDTSRDSSNNGAIATSSEAFPTNGPRTSSMAEAAKHANNFPPVEVLFPSLFPDADAASIKKPPPGPNGEPWTWQRHLRAFVEKNEQGWDSLRSLVSSMQPSHARSGGECSANKKSTTELRASGFQCQDSGRTRRALYAQRARDEHQQRHLYNL